MIKRIAASILPGILKHVPRNIKALYPFYLANQLDVVEEDYASPHLPAVFDGLSIGFASDIHFGPLLTKEQASALFNTLVGLETDIIILGGDYGDVLENSIRFFEHIPAFPYRLKVFAVLGNHDYGKKGQSVEPLLLAMKQKNVIPLVNQCHPIEREGKRLVICGPDDIRCGRPDFKPLKAQSAKADFVLFIPHSPDLLPRAQEEGFVYHLAQCGHTHGGQIVMFGRSLHSSSIYKDRYRSGWYKEEGRDIMVSNGVGTSILPMRLGTRPQVHKLRLRAQVEA